MGFVSYLEDIRDRFDGSLKGAELALRQAAKASNTKLIDQELGQLRKFLAQARSVIKELEANLDLATDPKVDLAHEIINVREQLRRSQVKFQAMQGGASQARSDLDAERAETKKWKSKWDQEKKERRIQQRRADGFEEDVNFLGKSSPLAKIYLKKRYG